MRAELGDAAPATVPAALEPGANAERSAPTPAFMPLPIAAFETPDLTMSPSFAPG